MPKIIGQSHATAHHKMINDGFRLVGSDIEKGRIRNFYQRDCVRMVVILRMDELIVIMVSFQ